MLFAHFAFLVTLLALGGLTVATQTRPCLVSAMSSQSDPDNLQDICATNVGKVWAKIVEFCGDERQSALEQLKDTCTSAGYTIAYKPTASSDIASHSTALFSSTKPSSVIASSTGISTSSSAPDASSSLCPSTHPNQTISLGSADRGASAAAFAAVVFVGFAATL